MLIILSPSKSINFKERVVSKKTSTPRFEADADYLMSLLSEFHADEIAENRITNPEYLQAFDSEGYFYNPQLSNEDDWFFTR
jgi:cytoplasmic iron level regulating protein YaaA (DUF328/UPF0246 family)